MAARRTTGRRRPRLHVAVTDGRGRPVPAGGLAGWLAQAAPAAAHGTVSVALVTDAAMRRLNRRFRGVDRATDVLSFPDSGGFAPRTPGTRPRVLGDIAIATGVARRQAHRYGHSLRTEIRTLALHGLLHLLGYDHERDRGEMARVEERLRRRTGLPAGLLVRPPRRVRPR